MFSDFTKASTIEVAGRGIAVLKLSEGSLWAVETTGGTIKMGEAIRRIALWHGRFSQPRRINLLELLAFSSWSFLVAVCLGEEDIRSYFSHAPLWILSQEELSCGLLFYCLDLGIWWKWLTPEEEGFF